MSNPYIVYMHANILQENGDLTAADVTTPNPVGYGVYVLNDSDVDDMPEEKDFSDLAEAEKFADEMAEKYDTYIERY